MESIKRGILLSGGIDSISLAYNLKPQIAYTIDYGQTVAKREIYVSKYIAKKLGIVHKVITVDCRNLGSGTLANKEIIDLSPSDEWWPYRNQLLITLSAMQAIKDGVSELYLASVKSDNFHSDGTNMFYELINELVNFQEGNIKIICPTLEYYSHELVKNYNVPLDLLSLAHSCHISNLACGKCSGCIKQLKVRHEVGL
ncbi:7-cyano-7-deazaguanine synthase [Kaistella sp. BT6-1-3]|uniref:7-cyano-7-deazaguanine synthase n=1 Tax=Kaistella yananensis TaxID=2989820 RepID=A0ABT3JN05_9FLAO|nr:7-cyano-7-deazaguanine synthase [Kaistella yananensis]MCW4452167.1 7-cyano-7-deazaguanine synthase [Kaistella yananensis]